MEVLFAITIFSMVAVAAISLMNKGIATAQRSLEITTVRQEIDGQAETLRFLHDAYINTYQAGVTPPATTPAGRYATIMSTNTKSSASAFIGLSSCPDRWQAQDFVVVPKTGEVRSSIVQANISPQLVYQSTSGAAVFNRAEGIWVEAVRSTPSTSGGVGFIDFHIRACWDTVGQSVPMTLGTIVRLYDPR
ncbi:hypothetical protein KI440_03750 [Candidatus Saccharibacteria bacterium TM7i]|nr:hypothetical protein KI440_03750 [Candidatus Saccharibacteria bacterium TM7i]